MAGLGPNLQTQSLGSPCQQSFVGTRGDRGLCGRLVTQVAVMVATLLDGKITAMAGPLGHRTLGSYLSFQPSPPSATGDNIQLLDRRSLSASAQTVGCYLPLVSPSQPDLSPKPLVIGGDCRGGEMNGLWGVDEGPPWVPRNVQRTRVSWGHPWWGERHDQRSESKS